MRPSRGVLSLIVHYVWPGQMVTMRFSLELRQGSVVWPMRGVHGFGFDPMFQPDGYDQTFGEMLPEQKHPLSHRADAFKKLVSGCLS